ncbi:MAG: glycoside hydrolase family 25 protein [Prevotellaceae bacterium]|nr:glycoside hydrolase family 25 protein [Prevotellaceae bacterium]
MRLAVNDFFHFNTSIVVRRPKKKRKSIVRQFISNQGKWIFLGGTFSLTVFVLLFYTFIISPYRSVWRGLFGETVYPEFTVRGIDISHHNGPIDWQKAARSNLGGEPLVFVFVKATEGLTHLDKNFNENFYQAHNAGLICGAYHYFKPRKDALRQAEYFLHWVHLEDGDLPPVLDVEEEGGLSSEQLQTAVLTWLNEVERRMGVTPIIYASHAFRKKHFSNEKFSRYPFWLAHYYVKEPRGAEKWHFWQHTDNGKIDGIRGKVDLNVYSGSMYELRRLTLHSED